MKNIVILGAGTGGTMAANIFAKKLNLDKWSITVIDKSDTHVYQPGLLFIPMKLYGYTGAKKIVKKTSSLLSRNVNFVQSEIKLIDHKNNKVETENGTYEYDFLISAMGCRMAPDEVEGMEEAMGNNVNTFYTLEGALALQKDMQNLKEGHLVVHISEMPIKCPVAPIEFVFLADYYYDLMGVRKDVEISLVTPLAGAFTKPIANRILTKVAQEKNIKVVPDFSIEAVDADNKKITSFEGKTVDYDLLVTIPPNLGPEVIEESDLGDGVGYLMTDPRTLKSKRAENGNVYVLGDNSNVSTSKAGSVVHFEVETVAENIVREIKGKKPLPSFDGHSNCFIESGYKKALLIDFNYDAEPLPGAFPFPGAPFALLEETYINHLGKLAFKYVYWHMLLNGVLSSMTFLPARMSFLGKDLRTISQVRRSENMQLKEIMSTNIVTVMQGTPLKDAAKLMTDNKVSGLPVVDVDDNLIGVLTEGDFISALDINAESVIKSLFEIMTDKKIKKKHMGTIVDDLMTKNPFTLRESDTLQKAVEVMDKNKVKRVIITDNDKKIKGVVSRADLVKLFTMK